MTQIFEEISGSNCHKEDYDRLRKEMLTIQDQVNNLYHKKKGMNAERREAKMEKEEAERYNKMLTDLQQKEMEFQLCCLHFNEIEVEEIQNELNSKKKLFDKQERKKATADESVKVKKKEHGEISRQIAKLEHEIREKVYFFNNFI